MGFSQIYVYPGGIFEWLLLQDIYGEDSFPTTKKELDILKYKGDTGYSQYKSNFSERIKSALM